MPDRRLIDDVTPNIRFWSIASTDRCSSPTASRSKLAGVADDDCRIRAGGEIRPRRERPPDRRVARGRRSDRAQGHPADLVRAASRAGPRRAPGSARGRRDHDSGSDVGAAAARVPGPATPGRADRAHHCCARRSTWLRTWRRSASRSGFGDDWLKFIGYKAWVDGIMGEQRGDVLRARLDMIQRTRACCATIMWPEGRDGAADEHDARRSTTPTRRRATSRSCSCRPRAAGSRRTSTRSATRRSHPARRLRAGADARRSCSAPTIGGA